MSYIAARATPPGSILRRELEAHEMSQAELAAIMKRPKRFVSEIVKGKKEITQEIATELEAALGVPADFWLRLEAAYQLELERGSHPFVCSRRPRH